MAKVKIQGHASGTGIFTVTAPDSDTNRTITLPDGTGTLAFTTDDDDKLPLAGGTMTGLLTASVGSGDSPLKLTSTDPTVRLWLEDSAGKIYLECQSGDAVIVNDTVERMRIDSSGNVGIGTSTAASMGGKFNVGERSGGTADINIGIDANNRSIHTYNDGTFSIGTRVSSTNYFSTLVIKNGNVGIGIPSSPAGKLHITTTATASLASATINEVSDFSTSSRVGFSGLPNNNDGMYFGMGVDGGISAGMGFFREASGWNSALTFYTNNQTSGTYGVDAIQEQMRIDSSGRVGIGTASPSSNLEVCTTGGGSLATILVNGGTDGGSDGGSRLHMKYGGSQKWAIQHRNQTSIGSAHALVIGDADLDNGAYINQNSNSWSAISDERLKTSISQIENAVDKLNTLQAISFKWKYGSEERKIQNNLGLLAQEVYEVFPEAVDYHEIEDFELIDHPTIEGTKQAKDALGISPTVLIAPLVKAIQELSAKNEELTTRIEALENP